MSRIVRKRQLHQQISSQLKCKVLAWAVTKWQGRNHLQSPARQHLLAGLRKVLLSIKPGHSHLHRQQHHRRRKQSNERIQTRPSPLSPRRCPSNL